MIEKIESWIDETNLKFAAQAESCISFKAEFDGYYSAEFLRQAKFVPVDIDDLPKPDFPELRQIGMGELIDMSANGITYKNNYFVRRHKIRDMSLHFHELVHVVQWQHLGAQNFISRYIHEIQQYGYHLAPLEKMACSLVDHFASDLPATDVVSAVRAQL